MRSRSLVVTCMILSVIGFGFWAAPAAQASCVGPNLNVSPAHASQGEPITITGNYYWDGCNDVIICHVSTPTPTPEPSGSPTPTPEPSGSPAPAPSPTSSCEPERPIHPLQNLRIEFVQSDRVLRLGTVDADSEGAIRLETRVPDDANFGDATIRACTEGCPRAEADFLVIGVLASTGSAPMRPIAAAGIALILAGVGLVVWARRAPTAAR